MKKGILLLLLVFVAVGVIMYSSHVFADDDKSGDNGKSRNEINTGVGIGASITASSDGGNNSEDHEQEREIKNRSIITFVDDNGNNISMRVDIKTRTKGNQTFETIKVKEIEVESEVEIENSTDGQNQTHFKARLSNGNKEEIKVMPDRASARAIQVLENKNLTIVLRQVGEGNNSKVLYFANGTRQVKLMGLFKVHANLVAVINPQTGQVEEIQKPWWFFLVFGNDAVINTQNDNSSVDNSTTPSGMTVSIGGNDSGINTTGTGAAI